MQQEDYFKIVAEEHEHLRQEDIKRSMKIALACNFDLEHLRQTYEANKDMIMHKAQERSVM